MSNRSDKLLGEMQQVFGPGFARGDEDPVDEGRVGDAFKAAGRGAKRLAKKVFGRKKKAEKDEPKEEPKKAKKSQAKKSKKVQPKKFKSDIEKARERVTARSKKKEEPKKSKADVAGPSSLGGGGTRQEKHGQVMGKKSARRHFPFKRSANLGPGPRNRHHDETKCWRCKCGNVYREGCRCVSSGKGENCPDKGTVKKISFEPGYKRAYNREYHMWRARQGGRVTQRLGSTRTAL